MKPSYRFVVLAADGLAVDLEVGAFDLMVAVVTLLRHGVGRSRVRFQEEALEGQTRKRLIDSSSAKRLQTRPNVEKRRKKWAWLRWGACAQSGLARPDKK